MSEPFKPRVAFYGGMANNCYLAAAQMHALGFDVVYIRDRIDNYAISQPVWEDHRLTIAYDELTATSGWTAADWDALEQREGWTAPAWVVDPLTHPQTAEPDPDYADIAGPLDYVPGLDHIRQILALMQSCDLVFVSGAYSMMFALLSGVRFVICPAGGEFMIASGVIRGEGDAAVTLARQARLLIAAFHKTQAILTDARFLSHRSLTGGLWPLLKTYSRIRFERVTLPFPVRPQLDAAAKRESMDAVLARLGVEPVTTRFAVFVSSRIDYQWKGQDRILEALRLARSSADFTFIFAGWGADYHDFIARVGGQANFRILDRALSKPLIYDLCQAADLVIDQFTLGHIGSASREAAAVGTPVMAWVERGPLARLFGADMPVLNARTPRDIARWFDRIASGRVCLQALGRRARRWIQTDASPQKMARILTRHAAARR